MNDDNYFPLIQRLSYGKTGKAVKKYGFPEFWLKPYQILIWISLTRRYVRDPAHFPETTPRIPALLDTGSAANLLISEPYFRKTRIKPVGPDIGPEERSRGVGGSTVKAGVLYLDLWVHAYDWKVDDPAIPPHKIPLGSHGIHRYSIEADSSNRPNPSDDKGKAYITDDYPLPLLGLRALSLGRVKLVLRPPEAVENPREAGWVDFLIPRR